MGLNYARKDADHYAYDRIVPGDKFIFPLFHASIFDFGSTTWQDLMFEGLSRVTANFRIF